MDTTIIILLVVVVVLLIIAISSYNKLVRLKNRVENQLKDIEDKIAYARQFYNDTVNIYNDAVGMFPSNIFANIFNFKRANLFELTNPQDAENIKIQF